ncbi:MULTISPECIES: hypothetical protein [Brevibacterium]|nr:MULTISPECIES: hypothetical protein [Brevibacterium]MCM1012717.1 hypothetical protein [Brevibacterium sp. XM4083]QPR40772.1 hypothetical protein I6G94_08165 [Brevibacterium casei]QPR44927.1 hypothetical protein I6G93_05810 [Brevibacterium casei]
MAQKPKRDMDIAEAANSLKTLFITQNLSLVAMLHPGAPILEWHRELTGAPRDADIPVDLMKRDTDEGVRFSALQAFEYVRELPSADVQKDLLAGPMLLGATKIGNLLIRHDLNRSERPLTQFARHFRNAAAHGDSWYFKGEEPKSPAYTRDVCLDQSLDGSRATFETVGPYEYVMFLDEIAAFAKQVTLEKAIKLVYQRRDGKNPAEIHVSLQQELESRGFKCSDQSVQWHIAQYTAQVYNGKLPEVNVAPQSYPLENSN